MDAPARAEALVDAAAGAGAQLMARKLLELISSAKIDRGVAAAVAKVRDGGVRLAIELRGKPVAALVSTSDLALLLEIDLVRQQLSTPNTNPEI